VAWPFLPRCPQRKHQSRSPFEHAIRDYYIYLNGLIGDLVALTDDVGYHSLWTFENDTGPDDANHAQHGIFILHGPKGTPGRTAKGARIMDIAPTILTLFGLPIPRDMQGTSIL
jgi:predicted AlkP superfamily phosphohydrolase/phosphomutase